MTNDKNMPDVIYVFSEPTSIGDLGFTVTHEKEGYIEYTRTDLCNTDGDVGDAIDFIDTVLNFIINGKYCEGEHINLASTAKQYLIKLKALMGKIRVDASTASARGVSDD